MKDLIIGFLLGIVLSVSCSNALDDSFCSLHLRCGECLRAHPACAWCTEQDEKTNLPRCGHQETLRNVCAIGSLIEPRSSASLTQDVEFSKTTQMRPQRVEVVLRPGSPVNLTVRFRQAQGYPVDLYFLTDASNTMSFYQGKLVNLIGSLAQELKEITEDFRLGYGTFVDKPTMPFIPRPLELLTPKIIEDLGCRNCELPYSYKHRMSMTNDDELFKNLVRNTKMSFNLDAPEGGFDALVQAVVCTDIVGWRNNSRKLVIFATDAPFHYAGDGRLAGIAVPNDLSCHLDPSSQERGVFEYTKSLVLDYPSVGELNRAIKRHKVNVIFAIKDAGRGKEYVDLYREVTKMVEGSAVSELLDDNSSILKIIKDQYKEIRSSVSLQDNSNDAFKVVYSTDCLNRGVLSGQRCELGSDDEVSWNVTIELLNCSLASSEGTLKMWPQGLSDELEISYKTVCACQCESPGQSQPNSAACSLHGDLECGTCVCHKGYEGKKCECEARDNIAVTACIPPNSTTRAVCSGRGECICGRCQCKSGQNPTENVYGEYCEYDNFSCEKSNGLLCGGHGTCDKGFCTCHPNWTGPSCACATSEEPCKTKSGRVCNGHGRCVCGKCECDQENGFWFVGEKCEQCPSCPSPCDRLGKCVACWDFDAKQLGSCPPECAPYEVSSVSDDEPAMCSFRDPRDFCTVSFSYEESQENGMMRVRMNERKVCPEKVNPYIVVGSMIGGILVIGIALMFAWKVAIIMYDKRQVQKFQSEVAGAGFQKVSSIRKPATVTYRNPAYRQSGTRDVPRFRFSRASKASQQ